MSSSEKPLPESIAGTPRIALVFGVSLFNYVSHALIRYSTPLYFNALEYPEETSIGDKRTCRSDLCNNASSIIKMGWPLPPAGMLAVFAWFARTS